MADYFTTKESKMMNFSSYKEYLYKAIESVDPHQIENFIEVMMDAFRNDKTIFVIGNGGSAASASHMAQDLSKGTRATLGQQKRFKALSLTDNTAFLTALGNDDGFDTIFEQQLINFAKPGDLVLAISGSGNSPNIVRAIEWANSNGLITVGVTGFGGGKLREINHHSLHVPLNDMCTAESIHNVLFHYIVIELQERVKAEVSKG
jgi:D-sedoheptulose 7-phosphate isomerase